MTTTQSESERSSAPTPELSPPSHASTPAAGNALSQVQAIRTAGPEAVAHVATIATDHPREWPGIAQWLQKARGNEFVQHVMARLSGHEADYELARLTPEQRQEYDKIRARDPEITEKDAIAEARSAKSLTPDDKQAVMAAVSKLASVKPRPINPTNDPNLTQIEVSFDGTWDDRDEMAFDTNPALIEDLFHGTKHYEIGVATSASTDIVGGWFGAGISNRIDAAYNQVVADVNAAHQANPNAQVALVVSGFSRGSAAARAFVNVLNKRGVPDTSSAMSHGHHTKNLAAPRIGAMILFDTVGSVGIPGTDLNPGLDLSIPGNAENVLHITARDESRTMFPLSSAVDPKQAHDPRITELSIPGAHSDIGGSYRNDYSKIPLAMSADYLRRAGANVGPTPMPDVNDPSLRIHDTGGGGHRKVFQYTNEDIDPALAQQNLDDNRRR